MTLNVSRPSTSSISKVRHRAIGVCSDSSQIIPAIHSIPIQRISGEFASGSAPTNIPQSPDNEHPSNHGHTGKISVSRRLRGIAVSVIVREPALQVDRLESSSIWPCRDGCWASIGGWAVMVAAWYAEGGTIAQCCCGLIRLPGFFGTVLSIRCCAGVGPRREGDRDDDLYKTSTEGGGFV